MFAKVYIKRLEKPPSLKLFSRKVIDWFQISREVARFQRLEERKVKEAYYLDPGFRKVDRSLKRAYFLKNPYTISRRFWQEHCYGETPLSSLELIGERVHLGSSDGFVDLGAGRGRGVFFIRHRFGCKAVAVEKVPAFVETARRVQEKEKISDVQFTQADLSLCELPSGNVFYIAWTCFSEELVELLTHRLEALPKGVKVITISFPIPSQQYACSDTFSVPFPWGNGDVFVHHKIG